MRVKGPDQLPSVSLGVHQGTEVLFRGNGVSGRGVVGVGQGVHEEGAISDPGQKAATLLGKAVPIVGSDRSDAITREDEAVRDNPPPTSRSRPKAELEWPGRWLSEMGDGHRSG